MAASRCVVATLDAEDAWTGPIVTRPGRVFMVANGTFRTRLIVQRSHDDGATWLFVQRLPAGKPALVENVVDGAWYRVGFGHGDYVSGAAVVELAQ